MIRLNKLYRLIPGKDSELPELDFQDDEDGLPILAPSKKKVSLGLAGATATLPAKSQLQLNGGGLELDENDIVGMVAKVDELSNATKKQTTIGGIGSASIDVPDEELRASSKKYKDALKSKGIEEKDIKTLASEFKDFPQEAFSINDETGQPKYSQENLLKLRKENPIEYYSTLNNLKTTFALANKAGLYVANKFNQLHTESSHLPEFGAKIKAQQDIINENLEGSERQVALDRLKETAARFIDPNNSTVINDYENQQDLNVKIDINQYAGLKTLELFDPPRFQQALKALDIDIKSLNFYRNNINILKEYELSTQATLDKPNLHGVVPGQNIVYQQIGKEGIMRMLGDIGRNNAILSLNKKQYDIDKAFKNSTDDNEKAALQAQYVNNQQQIEGIKEDEMKDVSKYPLTEKLHLDNLAKELTGQPNYSVAGYGFRRFGKGFENTGNTIEDKLTDWFGSDKDKTKLQLKRMGEEMKWQSESYFPEGLKQEGSPMIPKFSKELQAEGDAIADSNLSDKEKQDKLRYLISEGLQNGEVDFITNPNAGKSKNFFSKATLYGNVGLLGDIASFASQSYGLGVIGTSKMLAAATPLFTVTYSDVYNNALLNGSANPEGEAVVHSAIMAAAGMINPNLDIVKRTLGVTTSLGKIISGVDEATWNKVVKANKPIVDKFITSAKAVGGEASKMTLTYGVGTSIASDLANRGFFDQDISVDEIISNAIKSGKHLLINSAGLLTIGAIRNFKSVPLLEKSKLWEAADNKDITFAEIEAAVKNNKLSAEQGEQRKKVVTDISNLIEKVPTENLKGKPLTDKQRVNYLYNLYIKSKADEIKKTIPEQQKDILEGKKAQADVENNIIIEDKKPNLIKIEPGEEKTFTYDSEKDIPDVLLGTKPIKTETIEGEGGKKIKVTYSGEQLINAGMAERPNPPESNPVITPEGIESKKADIEKRRKRQLQDIEQMKDTKDEWEGKWTTGDEKNTKYIDENFISDSKEEVVNKINAKFDAELQALESQPAKPEGIATPVEKVGEKQTTPTNEDVSSGGANKTKPAIILPEQNKVAENIPLKKTNETPKEDIKPVEPVPTETKEPIIEKPTSDQPAAETGTGEGAKPPISEPPKTGGVFVQRPATELSHRGLQVVANEFSLPDVQVRDRKSDLQLRTDARVTTDRWAETGQYAKNVEKLVEKAEAGEILTDEQRVILEGHLANISGELRNIKDVKSPEFDAKLAEIKRLKDAGEKTRSEAGAALRIPSGGSRPNGAKDLSDFMVEEMDAAKTDKLTDKQKETSQKEYEDISAAKKKFDEYVAKKETELSEREAAIKLQKITKTAKKDAKKDYAAEREKIVGDILLKLSKARGESASFLGAAEIASIVPDVLKLVKNVAEQGVVKLSEVVDRVYEVLKDKVTDIEKKHINDIIAGVYNEKKKTRTELATRMMDLKVEANLINKLDALEKGEVPKSENKKIQRNREIKELREKIKPYTDLQAQKTKMTNEINEIKEQIRSGNFEKEVVVKQKLELDKEGNKLRDELIKLRQQRELRLLLQQRQGERRGERALRLTAEVANIPRTLMTIADFSALLRQNLFFSVGHPLMTSKAVPGMFRTFTSQKIYDRWFADLKESPRYEIISESRLAIADSLSHDLTKREEAFMSTIAEKIPLGIGKIVKGSERSYTMLLNKMRVDMFNYFADSMEARGVTIKNSPKAYKAMAEYINNATGRSDFGDTLNRVAPILNSVFFSPRLIASRINMLTYWAQPRFWKTLPKEARVDYFRNWISLLAVGGTILAVAKMGGAEVEDDPRSSDFGKIKSGDTRWDIWGGAQPYVRVMAQLISGKRKSTNTGKLYSLSGDDIFGEDRWGVVLDFFRNKLAPVPGAGVDLLSGRTTIGDKIVYEWSTDKEKEISIRRYIQDRLMPMTISGTAEAMKDQGVKALFTVGIPSTFGVGSQTYEKPKPKAIKPRQQRTQQTRQ